MKFLFFSLISVLITVDVFSQISPGQIGGQNDDRRVITTAVPFLRITPDARSGAMGDAGAAISPDANSAFWNPGKVAFNTSEYAGSISYTPWLAQIIDDMFLAQVSGYYKLDREQAIAASLTYFDLGEIFLTDENGGDLGTQDPREFAFNFTYSRKLSDLIGLGISLKYIRSNLLGSLTSNNFDFSPANSVAVDIGAYFTKDLLFSGANSNFSAALVLSNIGRKITYSTDSDEDFIPGNIRLGTAFKTDLDPYNSITFALDFNKLLVPTLAEDNDRNLLSGTFGSFGDAPGGFSEELQEITISSGVEYWYRELFAARAGYFWEHENKGNRQYFTLGVGLRYQVFGLDFAYLLPTSQNNPLADTLRFTLLFTPDTGDSNESITSDN
ncbi:MAG: type IX secretion system outer membrane channel protein PorV [Bacteroidota bacterium]